MLGNPTIKIELDPNSRHFIGTNIPEKDLKRLIRRIDQKYYNKHSVISVISEKDLNRLIKRTERKYYKNPSVVWRIVEKIFRKE